MKVGTAVEMGNSVVYTILGDNGKTGSLKKFLFECSVCSKDKELFPNGILRATKGIIKKKALSCGCSKNHTYTKKQQNIRLRRKAEKLNLLFRGYVNGYTSALKTTIHLESPINGYKWDTTTVSTFLSETRFIQDPVISKYNRRKASIIPDSEHIKRAMETGNYLEGTKFSREVGEDSSVYTDMWYYVCPLCSNDEYVKAGVCDGKFKLSTYSLKKGQRSCRCSTKYKYTEDQRIYQLNCILQPEGGGFTKWVDSNHKNNQTRRFWYKCGVGHKNWSTIQSMVSKGYHCSSCTPTGYDQSKPASFYISRWYGYGESWLKFGITNKDVIERVKQIYSTAKLDYLIIFKSEQYSGADIWLAESEVKIVMDTHQCPKKWLPHGYTETVEDTEENYNRIIEILTNHVGDKNIGLTKYQTRCK